MVNIFKNNKLEKNNEPGLSFFREEIGNSEHTYRMGNVNSIQKHLLRQHSVLNRAAETYVFKNKVFRPAAIVLQGLKTVTNFHVAYLVGNPVSLTGTPEAVGKFNSIYHKGLYQKIDWQILNELITYGNAFEYVYMEPDGTIKSKIIKNKDAYPIYDENSNYCYFVEYWKNKSGGDEHFIIYYPTHVDEYVNNKLLSSMPNLTGLPIHYAAINRGIYDQFGDSILLDLIPIMDKIEALLSKLDDAITTLSLNPIGVVKGGKITENDMVNSNISGAVLNLDIDGDFDYVNAEMDYNCIKFELDQLYQQFNMVAAIPSSIIGQSNIANVSENTTSIIYQLTENRGKENINTLLDGFNQRWKYMRRLMVLNGDSISDEDFDSLNVSFNVNKPVDTKNDMENMRLQYEMGAISKRTIMEKSPYTTDSAQELQRLAEENTPIIEGEDVTPYSEIVQPE